MKLWPAGVDGLADLLDATTASTRPLSALRRQLNKKITQGQKAAIARITRVLNSGDVASRFVPKGFNGRLDAPPDACRVEASLCALLEVSIQGNGAQNRGPTRYHPVLDQQPAPEPCCPRPASSYCLERMALH
jgi:hypothetical protein